MRLTGIGMIGINVAALRYRSGRGLRSHGNGGKRALFARNVGGNMKTFLMFLMERHGKEIESTDRGVLDDDLSDAFDAWLEDLDQDTLIKYADEYGSKLFIAGEIHAYNKTLENIKKIKV